jgi:phospholipid/cholesterol/gamma-HCH transport system substrate-binding protein
MAMPQQKQLSWTDLRVGIFVLAGLLLAAVAIFYVTGARFWGAKYRVVTYMPEVNGVQQGAPVDLDGLPVGNVLSLSLTPRPEDRAHSVTMVLEIDQKYQDQIRTDSAASLATQGLLGDRYVMISRGLTGSIIPNNGVIRTQEAAGMQEVIAESGDLMVTMNELASNLRDTIDGINRGNGSLGKFVKDPALYNHLDDTVQKVDALADSIQQGQGSLGKLVTSDDLYNKTDSVMGNLNDAMTAVHNQTGTLGKIVYDPTMYNHVSSIAQNGDALLSDVRAGKGTLGKLATDDTLYNNVRDASASVRDATAKLNSNQGTAGKFFSDPALYDNLTGMTGDMRLMINDFRKNPKKFLHIDLKIF